MKKVEILVSEIEKADVLNDTEIIIRFISGGEAVFCCDNAIETVENIREMQKVDGNKIISVYPLMY